MFSCQTQWIYISIRIVVGVGVAVQPAVSTDGITREVAACVGVVGSKIIVVGEVATLFRT